MEKLITCYLSKKTATVLIVFDSDIKLKDFELKKGLYIWEVEKDIREIKIHVYVKRRTSDSSWEFLRIENKQIKTVQNNNFFYCYV